MFCQALCTAQYAKDHGPAFPARMVEILTTWYMSTPYLDSRISAARTGAPTAACRSVAVRISSDVMAIDRVIQPCTIARFHTLLWPLTNQRNINNPHRRSSRTAAQTRMYKDLDPSRRTSDLLVETLIRWSRISAYCLLATAFSAGRGKLPYQLVKAECCDVLTNCSDKVVDSSDDTTCLL